MAADKAWYSGLMNPILKNLPKFNKTKTKEVRADYTSGIGVGRTLFSFTYTGEKNLGELGQIKNYYLEYDILRIRSWQSFLESEITQTVFGRLVRWVIGSGLKLQCEPNIVVLGQEGFNLPKEFAQQFSRTIEARWKIYRQSKKADHSNVVTLDRMASRAYKNAVVGGDVLVILRYERGEVSVQLIDGAHVQSPLYGTEAYPYKLDNGNRIMYGVEVDQNRTPVAYHVREWQNPNEYYKMTRIPAKDETTGLTTAFLVYGLEYRLDNIRGLPLIAGVLETIKKMERYKEATVASAEERAKIAYFVEHGVRSTGENPLIKQMARAYDVDNVLNEQLPVDVNMKELQNTFATSMNKQMFNMPIDSKISVPETKNDLYFKEFYTVNIDSICATLNIPPDVAKSQYNSNFSASRAALKDWEHTLHVNRKDFATQFYRPIYEFWLHIQVFKNKVTAPGFLQAVFEQNDYVVDSYLAARWLGTPVPHIDPLKEVNAERAKLGTLGAALPLTTLEAATESLNTGESESNMEQFSEELSIAESLDITAPEPTPTEQDPITD